MQVGIDSVLVERFKKMKNLDGFLNKYFTDYEISYISTKKEKYATIAGIFATKEAFLKALKIGIGRGVELKNIEIKHTNNGAPYIVKTSFLEGVFAEHNLKQVDVSITHTKNTATAICIVE
ncbi:MAG: holo-ACP synthase [Spirochaetales bacterium]